MIYGHGKFSAYDTEAVSQALAMFAIGLPAHVISKIFNATFFSYGDTKTPLKYSLLSVGFNIVLNFVLMPYLSHVGLALATSCAAWLNIILQGSCLINKKYFNIDKKIVIFLLKLFVSCLTMFTLLEIADNILCDFKIYSGQISHIFILVIFGIFSFFCITYFLKIFYIKYLYEI